MKKVTIGFVVIGLILSIGSIFLWFDYKTSYIETDSKILDDAKKQTKVIFFNEAVNRYNKGKINTYQDFVDLYRNAYEQSYGKIKAPEHEKTGVDDEIKYLESVTDPVMQETKLKNFKKINKVNGIFAQLASEDYKATKMVEGFLNARKARLAKK